MGGRSSFPSLFLLGLTSIVGQVVVLRELTINFYGNEFFIGITIAAWLAWVALGSILPQRLKSRPTRRALPALQIVAIALLFIEIFFIRYLKGSIGFPGEIPNLPVAFFVATLSPAPFCFVLGIWWSEASALIAEGNDRASIAVNRGYFVETLGFILGGVAFSFALVMLPSFVVALILAVTVLAFTAISWAGRLWLRIVTLILIATGGALLYSPAIDLEGMSTALRFKHQSILVTKNSPFGQLTVTRMGDQTNFYESGLALGSDREEAGAEELIHFPMLEHPDPAQVLLLGGGFNGAVGEILKHGVRDVYYLELDPNLIALAKEYMQPAMRGDLEDPRVTIVNEDGYHFLKSTDEKFEVIIVNLPDPSTALIDRFYTEEFFRLASERLADGGILATHLSFAPDRPIESLIALNASVERALEASFPQVIMLPEETNYFLATRGGGLTYEPEVLIGRYEARGIENEFVIPPFIGYRLTTDRIPQAQELISRIEDARPNRSFFPIAYYYNSLHWLDHFYPRLGRAFDAIASSFWPLAIFIMIAMAVVLFRCESSATGPILSVAAAGFTLMSSEIVVIFVYQTVVGFLYYRLALLISALMAGMAAGVWLGNRVIAKSDVNVEWLTKLHLLLILFCAALAGAVFAVTSFPLAAAELTLISCAIMAGLAGALVFPFANHFYLSSRDAASRYTGVIYGADVAGSAVGAALPSIVLIPVYGVWQTLLFVGIVNVWVATLLHLRRPLR